jgi:uncharacterized membrane protein SpoIIM required for sporulation
MREHFRKPQLLAGFLLSFLAGILLANLTGGDSRELQSSLTNSYLGTLEHTLSGSAELLFYVAIRRCLLFFLLFFFGTGSRGIWAHRLFLVWCGLSYGYFCALAGAMGGEGILLCILLMFPQCLAYVPAYLGFLELSHGDVELGRWKRLMCVLFLVILLQIGILLESYINPIILQKILKLF